MTTLVTNTGTTKKFLNEADKYKFRSGFKAYTGNYSFCRELIITESNNNWKKTQTDDSTLKVFVKKDSDDEKMASYLTIMVVVPALTFCEKKLRKTFTIDNLKSYDTEEPKDLSVADEWAKDMKLYIYKGLPSKTLWHSKPKAMFLMGMARHAAILNSKLYSFGTKEYKEKILALEGEAIEIIKACSRKKGLAFCEKLYQTLSSDYSYDGTFYPLMTEKDYKTIAWLRDNSDEPAKYNLGGQFAKDHPMSVSQSSAPDGIIPGFHQLQKYLYWDKILT